MIARLVKLPILQSTVTRNENTTFRLHNAKTKSLLKTFEPEKMKKPYKSKT